MTETGHPPARGERPSHFRSAAYSQAALARITLSHTARDIADAARRLVPTTSDRYAGDGDFVRAAADLLAQARQLLENAVTYERTKGLDWDRITAKIHDTGQDYAKAEQDWRMRVLGAWLNPEYAESAYITPDRLAQGLADLDQWADNGEPAPVSGNLPPMTTAERAELIAQARALFEQAPPDDSPERRQFEIGLCRRTIELHEDLVARSPGDAAAREALAEARASLRTLLT
ncbi:hypothetical protein C1I98_20270 [Spongiactinospora gelatinilytica]|uniref:Uncharacterized protein n=1 Tax=Spongiactinospora gelatinilytica TaxID=2666298 RepID=A0A2W2G2H1_9ACTN|nr:hypothetical protein [Spongiactinospora gelatinilytica]PZG42132.1 hypothetical protein C1I98_20270 [Spongiactinospora gelatinilytica]